MSLIRRSFTFIMGTMIGVYVAQNYDVPNMRKLFDNWYATATHYEKTHRKPTIKPTDIDPQAE